MLTTLLASNAVGFRGRTASYVSVAAHVMLVAGAIGATATPVPQRRPDVVDTLVYRPPAVVELPHDESARRPLSATKLVVPEVLVAVPPLLVPSELPSIATLTPTTSIGTETKFSPAVGRTVGHSGLSGLGVEEDTLSRARTEHEVDQPVRLRSGQSGPRYPEVLRVAGVQGQVTMQFVVDTLGVADRNSFIVLEASHPLFAVAVREGLGSQRFEPAEAGGRRVRQLVVQTFVFNIHR